MTLELPVWQFVRIMVALEDGGVGPDLYAAWREAWREIDRELERLRRTDAAAFAELMMERQVVLDLAGAHRAALLAALATVTGDLARALGNAGTTSQHRDALAFERAELARLHAGIAAGQAGGPPER